MLIGFLAGRKKMSKCKNCNCDCHCKENLHGHHYDGDLCTCDNCECNPDKRTYKTRKEWATDMSFENEGGVVIDDTGECESCQ